ncbi:MAG TPA: hypothetical protein VFN37_03270 [Candidatus Baltobacteraceae bacterium]|nr:hypothetical protein [Candidatus Baltobacteraceae bacterium]
MVLGTWDGNRLLWRALAASVGLHLLLALFLPVWTAQISGGLQPVEAITFAHVARIQIQRPPAASLPAVVPRTVHRAPVVAFARARSELTAHTGNPHVHPSAEAAPRGKALAAAAPRPVAARSNALYARPAASAAISTQQARVAPSPQPETTQGTHAVAGTGASDRGGVLPLGATQDPVLDPNVLAQLAKRVSVHVTLIVTVGEDGHTKRVVFQPPLDAQTEQAIQTLLADANWDAAVCGGGVTCEGTATIKL